MKEIWRDIGGFEGYYQVSNFGNVRSLPRLVKHRSGKMYSMGGKVLAQTIRRNYLSVHLSAKNKNERLSVHRLVASAFIPNPEKNSRSIIKIW